MASQVDNLSTPANSTAIQVGSAKQTRFTFTGAYAGVQGYAQGSNDGTNFVNLAGVREDTGSAYNGVIGNTNCSILINTGGWSYTRFNLTAISSGTVTVRQDQGATFTLPLGTTPISLNSVGQAITSSSNNAFTVGANGTTNPAFNVDSSAASVATGWNVAGAAAASGAALSVLSSGTNENGAINAKGSGALNLQNTATGSVVIGSSLTLSAVNIITDTTTGTKIGTAGTQKLGFFGATPIAQPANTVDYVTMLTNLGLRATGGTASATFPGAISGASLSVTGALTSSGGGVGYAAGAGGAVTQATSKTTGVTLNKLSGQITMNNASLGSGATATFTLTNGQIAATDAVVVSLASGNTASSYQATVDAVGAGSCNISLRNVSGGALGEAVVLNFAVLKAVAA